MDECRREEEEKEARHRAEMSALRNTAIEAIAEDYLKDVIGRQCMFVAREEYRWDYYNRLFIIYNDLFDIYITDYF